MMYTQEPPTQPQLPVREPPHHHWYRPRNVAIGAGLVVVGALVGTAASGSGASPQPAPTVTATSVVTAPAPTATHTVNVQVTQTVNVPPPPVAVAHYHGTGSWNSPQFSLTGGPVTVKFSYWNNTDGFGGDNFMADLASSDDDQQIANDIATSGGKTTTLYPYSDGLYHLEVQATGSWKVTITQAAS